MLKGEKHKIEAHLSVRHALKVHEGKYQCNDQHSSYHMLHVRTPPVVAQKPMTISPFLLHPIGGDDTDVSSRQHYSTEAGYATIHDLTSSQTNDDDLFTRTWEPIDPETPTQILALPTKKPITTTTITGQQQQQQQHPHGSHHHHIHEHTPPHVQQMEHDMKHKLFYINTTNFDGNPLASEGRHHNRTKIGLVNLDLNPPPTPPPYYTTDARRIPSIYYAATPPSFPPPRTTAAIMIPHHTPAPPPPAVQHYPHNVQTVQYPGVGYPYKTHESYRMAPAGTGIQQQQSQYPIQTMQPASPPYYAQYPPTQHQYNPMVSFPAHTGAGVQTTTTLYQNPLQQYNQMPVPPQYNNVPNAPALGPAGGSIVATSAPIFASSSSQGLQPPPPPVITTGLGYGGVGAVGIGGMTSTISSGSTLSNQELSKPKGELHNFSFYR